ncbi:hypothetical protein THRCLA_05207 [Thraustotheca clavata]|uniref:Ubiquitin-like protease family profile domain-containing protein n=1 Tax=Thraustotheca clavata TaxID=74557 RepID=A0A1V9ZWM0_9STRA|nr:hypothetical protein THRCLA_05207 [Thraustotheca clavata]
MEDGIVGALAKGIAVSSQTNEQNEHDSDLEEVELVKPPAKTSTYFRQKSRYVAEKTKEWDEKFCDQVAVCSQNWASCDVLFHGDRKELEIQQIPRTKSRLAMPKKDSDYKKVYIPYDDVRNVRTHNKALLLVLELVSTSKICAQYGIDGLNRVVLRYVDEIAYTCMQSNFETEFKASKAKILELADGDVQDCTSIFDRKQKRKSYFELEDPTKKLQLQDKQVVNEPNKKLIDAAIIIHELISPEFEPRTRAENKKKSDEDEKNKLKRQKARKQISKDRVIVRYPLQTHARSRITLTEGDVARLAQGEFLNDNLIDFFFKFCNTQLDISQRNTMHFYSTHFYSTLANMNEDNLERIKRWTKTVPIFERRFLFVPVNENCHWSLAVICNPGGLIKPKAEPIVVDVDEMPSDIIGESQEFEETSNDKVACILYFDSLQCHNKQKIAKNLRRYLEIEFNSRFPEQLTIETNKAEFIEPDVPRQSNSCDCGVYLLLYAVEVIKRFPLGVAPNDVANNCRDQLSPTMFATDAVMEFRDYIHQVLSCLSMLQKHRVDDTQETLRHEGLTLFTNSFEV